MSRALALAALVLLGCSEEEPSGPTPALSRDIERLRLLMIRDPARQPVEEAERVAADRPFEAARRLRSGGIPAAEQQVAQAEAIEVRTTEGRGFRTRLVAAYRERRSALEQYVEVLEGGTADDDALAASLAAQARAEIELMSVDADMERIVPTELPPPETAAEPEGPERPRPRGR